MDEQEETQAIADARETRDAALSLVLRLAKRTIDHVGEHEEVDVATLTQDVEAAGVTWALSASYAEGYSFVRVKGHPRTDAPMMVTPAQLAQIMGNEQAGFDAQVPRQWVEMAIAGSELI